MWYYVTEVINASYCEAIRGGIMFNKLTTTEKVLVVVENVLGLSGVVLGGFVMYFTEPSVYGYLMGAVIQCAFGGYLVIVWQDVYIKQTFRGDI